MSRPLTARGYRGRGGGKASYIEAPTEWRGTTVQVCGLWPWAVGASSPTVGVPLGRNLLTGAAVCCDPLSWFTHAKLILNPSMFLLGLPGLGKSTLARRLVIGLAGTGATPLVLGDLKPDYVHAVRALGGQVVRLGRGIGSLNVLDVGAMDQAADLLITRAATRTTDRPDDATRLLAEAERLRQEAHGRRLNVVRALITLTRGSRTRDFEDVVLSVALRVLAHRWRGARHAPLLSNLHSLIEEGPEQIRAATLARGDEERYRATTDDLQRSLLALIDGPLGQVFARPTTERLRLDAPAVCLDVSGISGGDLALQAAALLACWSEGYGAIEASNALADVGEGPQRTFVVVLDELWRVLRAGEGLVDRVDELTRLNRNEGVAQIMITHSLADLRALPSEADRAKARGFVERAGIVVIGGLPQQELTDLHQVVALSRAERAMVSGWSTPPGWGNASAPPGLGRVLLKIGNRPGIPVQVVLTESELALGGTNARWSMGGAG